MNVEAQVHLTTMRGLLAFHRHELQTDLHAPQQGRSRMRDDTAKTDVTDRMDVAATDQSSDISDATLERLRHELAKCESALQRLDEKRYGDYIDGGESILWPWLFVQPTTERCAACRRPFERGAQRAGRT